MSVVDDIKSRLDIVETVSSYAALKKSGKYLKALCPFHTEKTPSFIVDPERQSWRCFGACATGGDVLSFVSQAERLDFGDTLRLLAQRTGVELSQHDDRDKSEPLYRVNQLAVRFYMDALAEPQGKGASAYLNDRGVSDEMRKRFELGFSPQGREALKSHLLALGISEDEAVSAGALRRDDTGATRDFFWGRLMFPIHDRRGRVAGFGGRALDDSNPKYLNTSATSIFDKRAILYGMHLAADSIRAERRGVIVEGYMDTIAAHQFGYTNVVASMGTALTEQQVAQLRPMAPNFVLALDPDAAGQEATLRSLESAWHQIGQRRSAMMNSSVGVLHQREPVNIGIAALPDDKDPDDLIRNDASEWERLTSEAVPLLDYLIPALASRFDVSTGQGKAQALEALAPLIAAAEPMEQESYIAKLAKAIDADERAVKANIRTLLRRGAPGRRRTAGGPRPSEIGADSLRSRPEDSLEGYALSLLLKRPELRVRASDYNPENFHRSEYRELFTQWQ
ncbi:MAG: DNA primase, partial [Chloroflexi bacterium]|nr:DNA primase [Chloroflexota bacterium]